VHRSPIPADSVARRFQRAFEAAGLQVISKKQLGDTIWVSGHPGLTVRSPYQSRAVAYWHGDSTHYRYYVAITAASETADRADSPNLVAFCGQIAKAAAIPGSTPREPTGEEQLAVWTRRP
jgi:hypothetical protein